MFPTDAKACLSHVWTALTPHEREETIARIEQLVAAECAIAQHEMHEAQLRKLGAQFYKPLSQEDDVIIVQALEQLEEAMDRLEHAVSLIEARAAYDYLARTRGLLFRAVFDEIGLFPLTHYTPSSEEEADP